MILYVANSYIFFLAVFTMSSPTKVLENPELFVCLSIVILSVYLSVYRIPQSYYFCNSLRSKSNLLCFYPEDKESFELRNLLALLWLRPRL